MWIWYRLTNTFNPWKFILVSRGICGVCVCVGNSLCVFLYLGGMNWGILFHMFCVCVCVCAQQAGNKDHKHLDVLLLCICFHRLHLSAHIPLSSLSSHLCVTLSSLSLHPFCLYLYLSTLSVPHFSAAATCSHSDPHTHRGAHRWCSTG